MEVLDTTVDYLLAGNESENRPLHSTRLMERFKVLENFVSDDEETIIKLIDAMLVKQRIEGALKPLDNHQMTPK